MNHPLRLRLALALAATNCLWMNRNNIQHEHPQPFEAVWRAFLTGGEDAAIQYFPRWRRPLFALYKHGFAHLPSEPRCLWCRAPFAGVGAPLMKIIGRAQSAFNPSICGYCEEAARQMEGGAEVPVAMLFADIRGSTAIAAGMSPAAFSRLINRFYRTTTDVLVRSHALVDKLIGDEVTAFFVPGFAGPQYVRVAVEAASELLRATGHERPEGPWVPVGVGVHSGVAFVGAMGSADGVTDITVLGDVPNVAARLASHAGPGEILVSEESWLAAGLEDGGTERRTLQLKGRADPFDVRAIIANA